jgi:hypothetical protein
MVTGEEEAVSRTLRAEGVIGLGSLLTGGAAAISQSAAPVPTMMVTLIVVGGLIEWWMLRKRSSETRAVGYRLLVLVGIALVAAAS